MFSSVKSTKVIITAEPTFSVGSMSNKCRSNYLFNVSEFGTISIHTGPMTPSYYLNQCWNIVNWTLENNLQCHLNRNLFIQENTFQNVVGKMVILSRPQCINAKMSKRLYIFEVCASFLEFSQDCTEYSTSVFIINHLICIIWYFTIIYDRANISVTIFKEFFVYTKIWICNKTKNAMLHKH